MKALSSMATRHLLADLAAAAHDEGLPILEIESTGGVEAARRVAEGERVDLVFLARDALDALAASGDVDRASVTDLVVSPVAVALRADDETSRAEQPREPAFDDAAGVREALRSAERIGYSTGPSGSALVAMIDSWGLADEILPRLVQARPGLPVATLLAAGDVDLGFQQLSELVGQPDVRILGVLPDDCAIDTVFAGAVARRTSGVAVARAVLASFETYALEIADSHSFRPVALPS